MNISHPFLISESFRELRGEKSEGPSGHKSEAPSGHLNRKSSSSESTMASGGCCGGKKQKLNHNTPAGSNTIHQHNHNSQNNHHSQSCGSNSCCDHGGVNGGPNHLAGGPNHLAGNKASEPGLTVACPVSGDFASSLPGAYTTAAPHYTVVTTAVVNLLFCNTNSLVKSTRKYRRSKPFASKPDQ